jgi:AraC-like DNA-binding protein
MDENAAKDLGVQRCGIFQELPLLLREFGAEPEPILFRNGFGLEDFVDPDRPLPFARLVRLLDDCARTTGAGQFGLVLGLKAQTKHLGIIGDMLRNAPSLGRAIRSFVENHHRYVRGGAPYVLEQDPYLVRHKDESLIGYRCMIPGLPCLQFLAASIGVGTALIRELTNQYPSRVLFGCSSDHLPAAEIRSLLKPSTVAFDSHHFGLTYRHEVFATPIAGADPLLYFEALQRIEGYWNGVGPDFVDQVRRLLMPVLLADRAHMRMLCEMTAMHPRTVNRRLAEHKTSLRTIVNETRFDIACQLLKHTHLPIAAVAEIMGYSEPGGFVRAFRHWSGATPDAWRKARSDMPAAEKQPVAT